MEGKSTNAIMCILKSDCQANGVMIAFACCIDKTTSRMPSQILVSSLRENKELGQMEDIGVHRTWRSCFKSCVGLTCSA